MNGVSPLYPYGHDLMVIPPPSPYVACVAKATLAGGLGGFLRGVYLAIFTEGASIPINTGGGAVAGGGAGLVACAK
jgi:hypothetical protein